MATDEPVLDRDGQLILQFDLESGYNADAMIAAEALIAWIEAVREASAVLDPNSELQVGLVSAEPACLRLMTVIRFIERTLLDPPSDALNETPKFKKIAVAFVIGASGALGVAAINGGLQLDFADKAGQTQEQPVVDHDEQIRLEEAKEKLQASPTVRAKVQKFYETVERDRHITRVSVSEKPGGTPLVSVPRSEFAERSGLWDPQTPEPPTRNQDAIWDVVVTYPALFSEPRVWGFSRDGLPFTARLEDEVFLVGIHDGTLPIRIQEGVVMRVQIVWQERLVGQTWTLVPRSRRIVRVLSPTT